MGLIPHRHTVDELSWGLNPHIYSNLLPSSFFLLPSFNIDPSYGLVELPVELTDSSQKVAQGCSSNADSSFVATGRGRIPQNPRGQLDANPSWYDIRDLSAYRQGTNNIAEVTNISKKPAIVEATGFMGNSKGEVELVASQSTPLRTKQVSTCSSNNT